MRPKCFFLFVSLSHSLASPLLRRRYLRLAALDKVIREQENANKKEGMELGGGEGAADGGDGGGEGGAEERTKSDRGREWRKVGARKESSEERQPAGVPVIVEGGGR